MVSLGSCLLEKSKSYKKRFKPQKPAEKLSDDEIREYLIATEMPRHIASPLNDDRTAEIISGRTGDLIYEGVLGMGDQFMIAHSGRKDAYVEYNTYFNRVLEQAVQRGVIKLREAQNLFSDVQDMKWKKALEGIGREIFERPLFGFVPPEDQGYVPKERLSRHPISTRVA